MSIITPHLVGYWPFEGNANDASGNGNNGTVYGATLTTGKFGQCYSFDGVDDKINCGSGASLDITSKISISGWYYLPEAIPADTYPGFVGKGHSDGWDLYFYPDRVKFIVNVGGARQDIRDTSTSVKVGEWIFLCATYDGTTGIGKIYVNGELNNTETVATGTIGTPTADLEIGVEAGQYFNGLIDEVRVYNKVLSQSDTKRIMLGLHPLNG